MRKRRIWVVTALAFALFAMVMPAVAQAAKYLCCPPEGKESSSCCCETKCPCSIKADPAPQQADDQFLFAPSSDLLLPMPLAIASRMAAPVIWVSWPPAPDQVVNGPPLVLHGRSPPSLLVA